MSIISNCRSDISNFNLSADVLDIELWRKLSKNSFQKFVTKSLFLAQICGLFENCINKSDNKCMRDICTILTDVSFCIILTFCIYIEYLFCKLCNLAEIYHQDRIKSEKPCPLRPWSCCKESYDDISICWNVSLITMGKFCRERLS